MFYNFNKPAEPDAGPWQCNWIVTVTMSTSGLITYARAHYYCYPFG